MYVWARTPVHCAICIQAEDWCDRVKEDDHDHDGEGDDGETVDNNPLKPALQEINFHPKRLSLNHHRDNQARNNIR